MEGVPSTPAQRRRSHNIVLTVHGIAEPGNVSVFKVFIHSDTSSVFTNSTDYIYLQLFDISSSREVYTFTKEAGTLHKLT